MTFEEAREQFRDFLSRNGRSSEIVWVLPENILLSGSRVVYLKLPVPRANEDEARRTFLAAMQRGMGVCLKGLYTLDDCTCSCVWAPRDQQDAEYALLAGGLKLSVTTGEGLIPRRIQNPFLWTLLKVRHCRRQARKGQVFL